MSNSMCNLHDCTNTAGKTVQHNQPSMSQLKISSQLCVLLGSEQNKCHTKLNMQITVQYQIAEMEGGGQGIMKSVQS
jgi:hypothetical protein